MIKDPTTYAHKNAVKELQDARDKLREQLRQQKMIIADWQAFSAKLGKMLGCDSETDAVIDAVKQLMLPAYFAIWQEKMVAWVTDRLGESAMEPHERAMRFGEEAIELLQAVGITKKEITKLQKHVFAKEPGRVGQEIGNVVTTLLTLSQSHSVDMNIAALMEIDRIHALPPEKVKKRQMVNVEAGIGALPHQKTKAKKKRGK